MVTVFRTEIVYFAKNYFLLFENFALGGGAC